MRFQLDYDLTTIYHIHSQLSLCSKDPEQNLENILRKMCIRDRVAAADGDFFGQAHGHVGPGPGQYRPPGRSGRRLLYGHGLLFVVLFS